MAMVPPDLKMDMDVVMKKPISELTSDELRARLKVIEQKAQILESIQMEGDLSDLGPNDLVMCEIPQGPNGEIVYINNRAFVGRMPLKLKTARQVAVLVSGMYLAEKELLISRNNGSALAGAIMHTEDLMKIRRYHEIMQG